MIYEKGYTFDYTNPGFAYTTEFSCISERKFRVYVS